MARRVDSLDMKCFKFLIGRIFRWSIILSLNILIDLTDFQDTVGPEQVSRISDRIIRSGSKLN
jgi:hypothetical protein